MRSKNSMYNLSAAMMLQVINLVVGIILPRVMLTTFGSEVNGLVTSIRQFINYLTLVEAGLAGACIYSLYKPLADNDHKQINRILTEAKRFYTRSGIIFSILALILAVIFPYIVQIDKVSNGAIIVLVLVLGINGSLEFFSMGKYRALLTAHQKSYIIYGIQGVAQILNCVIIIVMALNGYNIVAVQIVATTSYIVRTILLSQYVKRHYSFIEFNETSDKILIHQKADVLMHQIGGMVIFNAPIAMITVFCSLLEVSMYSIYNVVFSGISAIVSIFNSGMIAGVGEIISKGDQASLQRVYKEYESGYYMIVTWMYSCAYVLILPFISIYTAGINDMNYIRSDLAISFVILGLLNNIRLPQMTMINAAGHFKQTKYRALIEVIINVVASLILVNFLGLIGVLIGGMCSYAYRTIDYIFYAPKYVTKLPVKDTVIRIIRMLVLGLIIILPFETVIQLQTDNIIEWVIWGCIVAGWSGIIVFVGNFIIEPQTIKNLLDRVLMVLGKRKIT